MNLDFEAHAVKNHLRFVIGDIVYLNSDVGKTLPMTITRYVLYEDETDYTVNFSSVLGMEIRYLSDKVLTK